MLYVKLIELKEEETKKNQKCWCDNLIGMMFEVKAVISWEFAFRNRM